jgi:3-dehydroquinate synthase
VVSDRTVSDLHLAALGEAIEDRGLASVLLLVPEGEEAKSLRGYETLLRQLAGREAHRDDAILALGGGAVGDLAGFVASTYMRGIPFVQIPTTLTAQVDAAIGGKTAVNLPEGKNLVGAFAQPLAVLADLGVLATLDERDYRSGLAEVAKYALTLDDELLALLESDPAPLVARDVVVMEEVIARCVAAKARIVAEDERDTNARMVLNYGHTLGHALERLDAFRGRTHGEAIALGMVFAAALAEARGLAAGVSTRTDRLLRSLGLASAGPLPASQEVLRCLRLDKKYRDGVRFVLLEDVGRPVVVNDVSDEEVASVLREMGAPE